MTPATEGGSEAPTEALIRRAYRAFAARDIKTLAQLAHEDVEISTVTGVLAGRDQPYRGHAGIEDYMSDLAGTWKRIELQPQSFHAVEEDQMLVFGRARAWHDRGLIDSTTAWLWTMRDGRVANVRVFADPADARALIVGE